MKAIKWVVAILAIIIAVVAIVAVVGLKNLDAIVKAVVEEVGTDVTGTRVSLASVDIGLKEGRAELQGFSIANPRGFSDARLLSVGKVAVDIDPLSVTKDVIVIDEITLSGINILAEQKDLTRTNIEALLNNIRERSASSASAQKPEGTQQQEEAAEVLLAVKKFVFEKSDIKLLSDEWGELTVPLPAITLQNLGSAQKGLTPEQLAQQAMEPVLAQVRRSVTAYLKEVAQEKAEEKAKEALQKKLDEKLSGSEKKTLENLKSLFN